MHQCLRVPSCHPSLWLCRTVFSCSTPGAFAAVPRGPLGLSQHLCTDTLLLPGPPSAPRNLVYSLRQSSLVLEWSAPADAGGRSDLTYSLWCGRCPAALRGRCEQCGSSVGFVPQQTGLVDRTVTLVNLLPHVNYTIRVAALNGVSAVSPLSGQQYAEVNVSTSRAGTAAVWHTWTGLGASPPLHQGDCCWCCLALAHQLWGVGVCSAARLVALLLGGHGVWGWYGHCPRAPHACAMAVHRFCSVCPGDTEVMLRCGRGADEDWPMALSEGSSWCHWEARNKRGDSLGCEGTSLLCNLAAV